MNIRLNVSDVFYNKVNRSNSKSAFSYSFQPVETTLPALVRHIRGGKAFTVGHFRDNRRVESHFISSQLLALDLDKCELALDELERNSFIQEHAFLMYPTPSSTPENPKSRILFILDEPVEGQYASKRWRTLQLALMDHFTAIQPDPACKDPARLFYGCDTCHYYVNYDARLPLEVVANLVIPDAELESIKMVEDQFSQYMPEAEGDLSPLLNTWLNTAHSKLTSAPKGERHKSFVGYARWLYGLELGKWPITKTDIERFMSGIASAWGDDEQEIKRNLRWAEENATEIPKKKKQITSRGRHLALMARQQVYGTN